MIKELKDYIDNWQKAEGLKPKNEKIFIDMFINFLNGIDDCRDISFDGEGSYFGKQITVVEGWSYFGDRGYGFEIAYSWQKIVVYTAAHNGYWTPVFIELENGEPYFDEIRTKIHDTLYTLFGLSELNKVSEPF